MTDDPSVRLIVLTEFEDNVEAINKMLRDSGLAAKCIWAKSSESLEQELNDKTQLLIYDCDPTDNSVGVIAKIRNQFNPQLPLILLSEKVDEHGLAESLRCGARDVVSLNRSDRAQAVLARAIRNYRLEMAFNETLQSATKYKHQIKTLLDKASEPIAFVQEGIIVEANPAWAELLGFETSDDTLATPVMDSIASQSRGPIKGALIATQKGKWGDQPLTVTAVTRDGADRELTLQLAQDSFDGEPCVRIAVTTLQTEASVSNLSSAPVNEEVLARDPATQLYRRDNFINKMRDQISRPTRAGLRVLAWIKPDNFKAVRKDVGFIASEEVFVDLAGLVRKQLLPEDFAGRVEGTSILIMMERGSLKDAETWAERMLKKINKHVFSGSTQSTSISCTIGLCPLGEGVTSAEQLLQEASDALTSGRESGGDRVYINRVSESNTRIRQYDAIWVQHIKAALRENRFRLLHLPIAALQESQHKMYDLLVRMLNEQNKPVLPSEFFPAAERNNMMHAIDRWVIGAALEFCHIKQADMVFIKLSRQSMQDASLPAWLGRKIDKADVDPQKLCFQISEENAASFLRESQIIRGLLKELKIRFALEHVGIGRQPGKLIKELTPDFIKIDGSLIAEISGNEELQRAVESIVADAKKYSVRTIAERVEDANAMAVLWQLGIGYMQGHYVQEPEVVLEEAHPGAINSA